MKMTKYAEKILEIVERWSCHMTAEQVFDRLRYDFPRVVLATVYNNLNRLAKEGNIRRLPVEGMPDSFDRTQRHDHLLCRRCGTLGTSGCRISQPGWRRRPVYQSWPMI